MHLLFSSSVFFLHTLLGMPEVHPKENWRKSPSRYQTSWRTMPISERGGKRLGRACYQPGQAGWEEEQSGQDVQDKYKAYELTQQASKYVECKEYTSKNRKILCKMATTKTTITT